MYPTLVIIVCAIDRSLNEKLAEEHWHARGVDPSTVVFDLPTPSASLRRPGTLTLSELRSAASADASTQEMTPIIESSEGP